MKRFFVAFMSLKFTTYMLQPMGSSAIFILDGIRPEFSEMLTESTYVSCFPVADR